MDVEALRARAVKTDDPEELRAIVGEFYHLVTEGREETAQIALLSVQARTEPKTGISAKELAEAVRDFAEWQYGGYEGREPVTRSVVGRNLWYEVSDRVYAITGSAPEAPCFGPSAHDA